MFPVLLAATLTALPPVMAWASADAAVESIAAAADSAAVSRGQGAAASDSVSAAADSISTSATADSVSAGAGGDSASAHPDSAAVFALPDSLTRGASIAGPRRMADTVTVLPPVRVDDQRDSGGERGSATTVRLSRGDVARLLPPTAGEAVLSVPGVDLVRTGAWSSQIAVRGLAGERVLLMVDGVRLNTGRGHGGQSSLVPIDRLDAIELSPGAASGVYGSDALGGVLNLVTHRSLFAPAAELTSTTSLRGTTPGDQVSGIARLRYRAPSIGAEVSAGLSRLGALSTPDSLLPHSGAHDEDLVARVQWRGGPASADFEQAHHAARDIGIPAFGNAEGASGSYPLQARDASRLELGWNGGRDWTARMLASYQHYRTGFRETSVSFDSLRGRRIATTTVLSNDDVGSRHRSIIPELRLGPNGAVTLGGEYRLETSGGGRSDTSTTQNAAGVVTGGSTRLSPSLPRSRREVWSGRIAASEARWGFRADGGLRFDRYHSEADSIEKRDDPGHFKPLLEVLDQRWSAEGGLRKRIGVVEPYVHVASGFRAPSLDERFYDNDIHGGLRLFGNADLRAERSVSTELGVRLERDPVSLRVSAYRSNATDLISIRYLDLVFGVPRFQYENVARARMEGLEMTARLRAGSAMIGLHASAPRGRDLSTGESLTDIGATNAGLDLGVPLPAFVPQGRTEFGVRWMNAVSLDRPASEGEAEALPRPAFWTFAAQVGTTLWGSRVTLAARNLLNHRYREPLGFIDEPGRTLTLAVQRGLTIPITRGVQGQP